MHETIVEHVEEIENEWERPFGERLLKSQYWLWPG